MRVLGIDPGLRNTGFGVIEIIENKPSYITSGVITTNSEEALPLRIKTILDGISQIVKEYQPNIASIEKVFVNVNPQSTLLLGQARGAAIAACVLHNLQVSEYTALQVKQSVVGYGHAEKDQVAKMVKLFLNLNGAPRRDAADALAVAITHINFAKISKFFNMSITKKGRLIS
ncbi:MAG: crossover junction endodeoxyribonuclease RuvC [Burkholderiales bacterium]|nr:crossover junction endodeoxyribonuclease RuvC [Burkholderiales bacterium]MCE3267842.1 crossover junction endodeoxyribonuclease RuvC [Burkholderiales bacterium]